MSIDDLRASDSQSTYASESENLVPIINDILDGIPDELKSAALGIFTDCGNL